MDCKELYAQKLMTAAQAAALVKSGDWVDYGWAVNTPVAVDAELAKRLPELEGVNFRGGIRYNKAAKRQWTTDRSFKKTEAGTSISSAII